MNFVISLLTRHRNFSQSRGNPSTNHPLNDIYETDKLKIVIRRQWTSLLQFIKVLIASHEWIRSWQWSRQWLRDAKTILTSTDSSVLSSLEVGPVSKTSESSLPVAIGPWRHRRRVLGASTLYFQAKKTCTAMAALSPSPVWCAYPLPLFIPIFFLFLSFFLFFWDCSLLLLCCCHVHRPFFICWTKACSLKSSATSQSHLVAWLLYKQLLIINVFYNHIQTNIYKEFNGIPITIKEFIIQSILNDCIITM